MWNASPAFDGLSWDTLPSEFRKVRALPRADIDAQPDALLMSQRDINYSLVALQAIPRLSEFFDSV